MIELNAMTTENMVVRTMKILYKNPGFEHSIDSIMLFQTDNQTPYWSDTIANEGKMSRKIDKQIVYEYLIAIPKGKVVTYGQIAEFLGNKNLARIVGNILHENPDGDKYPCYKVVNAKGNLAKNYAFGGVGCQKMRLEADGVIVNNNKVDLKVYQWSYADHERLQRIIRMERYFDELLEGNVKNPGVFRLSKIFQNKIDVLKEYYQSGLWLQDYECDERGELPKNLKRGILSQDLLYDFLSEIKFGD